ncbi:hypothetical protein CRUP_038664 [Coryphaenoides rupestris]|nr:hypothetical protein CRUP_038664 [Coryphaenoides rupestris]
MATRAKLRVPTMLRESGGGVDEEAVDEEEEKQKKSAIKGVGKILLLCMMRMKEEELVHSFKSVWTTAEYGGWNQV